MSAVLEHSTITHTPVRIGLPVPAPDLANVPTELRAIDQWVCWTMERKRDGTIAKIPRDAGDGFVCDATDPKSWGTFAEATATFARCGLSGIGFVVTPECGVAGLDADKCVGPDGEVAPWAREIIADLDSYTETSPSETGVRIFVFGALPERGRVRNGPEHVELYDSGRFLTVTGHRVPGTSPSVETRGIELRDLHTRLFGAPSFHDETSDALWDEDRPPVDLSDYDLKLWRGDRFIMKPDGSADRSRTIFAIGAILTMHGLAPALVARALAERDTTLGHHKYDARKDADAEYRRIALRCRQEIDGQAHLYGKTPEERQLRAELRELLEQQARSAARIKALETMEARLRAIGLDPATLTEAPGASTDGDLPERAPSDFGPLLAENARLRARVEELEREKSARAAMQRNKALRPQESKVLEAAVEEVRYRMEADKEKVDKEGFVRVYLDDIADRAGSSAPTVSRDLSFHHEIGTIERKDVELPAGRKEIYLRVPGQSHEAFLRAATAKPDRASHGGSRPRHEGSGHEDAAIVERTTRTCRECGEIVSDVTRLYDDGHPEGIEVHPDTLTPVPQSRFNLKAPPPVVAKIASLNYMGAIPETGLRFVEGF